MMMMRRSSSMRWTCSSWLQPSGAHAMCVLCVVCVLYVCARKSERERQRHRESPIGSSSWAGGGRTPHLQLQPASLFMCVCDRVIVSFVCHHSGPTPPQMVRSRSCAGTCRCVCVCQCDTECGEGRECLCLCFCLYVCVYVCLFNVYVCVCLS